MTGGPQRALIGDIGGTNARFALAAGGAWTEVVRLKVADFAEPGAALERVLALAGEPVRTGVLAVAAPVAAGRAHLTNGAWAFDAEGLADRLGFERLELLNDFAAQALALPHLGPSDTLHLAGPERPPDPEAPMAVLGPGTGLGVAALLAGGRPLVGEGGHVTLPARTEREWQVLRRLAERYEHVSAERVLCGSGLAALHAVVAPAHGEAAAESAEAVTRAAAEGAPGAREALELFLGFLGTVAGDVALTFGALGGVYLSGGILPRLRAEIGTSGLAEAFLSKGRFRGYLNAVPLRMVVHPDPAFLGLARRAERA